MGKYLITGRQGSGKTTIIRYLQRLGYSAYNTDDLSEVTKLQDRVTNEVIDWPNDKVDWLKYAWNWQEEKLKELLDSSETVFIGAVTSNQTDFYTLFDRIFVITVTEETLKNRLLSHEHSSHHLPGAIDRILANHSEKQALFIKEGAEQIDGEATAEHIVRTILSKVS